MIDPFRGHLPPGYMIIFSVRFLNISLYISTNDSVKKFWFYTRFNKILCRCSVVPVMINIRPNCVFDKVS